jgi:hypothetical protein
VPAEGRSTPSSRTIPGGLATPPMQCAHRSAVTGEPRGRSPCCDRPGLGSIPPGGPSRNTAAPRSPRPGCRRNQPLFWVFTLRTPPRVSRSVTEQ